MKKWQVSITVAVEGKNLRSARYIKLTIQGMIMYGIYFLHSVYLDIFFTGCFKIYFY